MRKHLSKVLVAVILVMAIIIGHLLIVQNAMETSFNSEVVTRFVHNNLDAEALRGNVDIEYQVSLQGYAEARSRLTVDVLE